MQTESTRSTPISADPAVDPTAEPTPGSGNTRAIMRWFVREILGVVFLGTILFVLAGSLDWPMAWALLVIMLGWIFATAAVVIPRNPELLAERVSPRKGAKRWDTMLMSFIGILVIARSVIAGLDMRFGWSPAMNDWLQVGAMVLVAAGYALVVWATGANTYFSQIVRIQTERNHSVVTSGPYRFVRHPGYVGVILVELATPVLLGSWWACLPAIIIAILFIVRTVMEDRTLQAELNGYVEYTTETPARLVPGIW